MHVLICPGIAIATLLYLCAHHDPVNGDEALPHGGGVLLPLSWRVSAPVHMQQEPLEHMYITSYHIVCVNLNGKDILIHAVGL